MWGRIEVLGEDGEKVRDDIRRKYQALQQKFSDYKDYVAEAFLIQILWNSTDVIVLGNQLCVELILKPEAVSGGN